MAEAIEALQSCGACRATIYPEHLERHLAEYWGGQLLCGHCIGEKKGGYSAPAANPAAPAQDTHAAVIGNPEGPPRPRIQTSSPIARTHKTYARPLIQGGGNATRCRTFHCRITEAAIANMNDQINEWTDTHPDVEIKFVTTVMAAMNDKAAEQQMIINVFY